MAKIRRPRAETPKGFRDLHGAELLRRQEMLAAIAEVYRLHGFEPLETSAVETVEALGKFLPDVDRPAEGVFAFHEDFEDARSALLALRYDLTAPLARFAAQHRNDLAMPYRRYAMGPVWRNEKPGPGRFRQFYQCDADTVGSASPAADAELLAMLAAALEAVGIPRSEYVIRLNDRRLFDGLMSKLAARDATTEERADADATSDEGARLTDGVLRQIDKFDKVGIDGVRALLGKGRKDESGAWIEGVGLQPESIEPVLAFVQSREASNDATLAALGDVVGDTPEGADGLAALRAILDAAAAAGAPAGNVVIDPSVVRGLGYYTGPVIEAELTFEVPGEDGSPRQFGSIAGGGRYDDLVKRFTGQQVPATGISIGVDRLLAALEARGAERPATGPVVVTVMDRDRMADYAAMAADLRAAGIRAEVYLGNPKNFGNQLKYADRRGAPAAVIQGSDEAARGVVQVKDLALGARLSETATLEEWKDQPAQREVPMADLVPAIREILDR